MKILVIVGGTSDPSNSEALADAFIAGARGAGAETDKVLLRTLSIDHFDIRCYAPDFRDEPDFAAVRAKIEAADGLVLAAPIWNFDIPANVKNLIDRCGAFSLDAERRMRGQWKDMPFYLIYTGGSPTPAWKGLLRTTMSSVKVSLQYFGGAHAGTHFEPRCTPGKGRFGLVVDKRPESLAKLAAQGSAFAALVRRHVETGRLPLMITLKRRFYRLGQTIQRKLF